MNVVIVPLLTLLRTTATAAAAAATTTYNNKQKASHIYQPYTMNTVNAGDGVNAVAISTDGHWIAR
jgi:hypothetical protein